MIAIVITFGIVLFGTAIGLWSGAGRKRNLEEWSVAGRSFGVLFMWLLMAGEIYTTFAFLGASGWAYSRGGPALYIMAYLTLGYVISFFILPHIWELGRAHGLQTQSDFFLHRYRSKPLALLVSIAGVLFLIPYVQLQLTGLGIIVQVTSFDRVPHNVSIVIAVALVAAFVFIGGIRAVAWVSVLKDLLMILAAIVVGIVIPIHLFGGIAPVFHAIAATKPAHLTMPGSTPNLGHSWFISTVLLSACGFYMWPHTFGATFTAKSSDVLRRNAIVIPLYTMSLALIFIAGFAALLYVPGLKGPDADMSLLLLARKALPPWFLGVIGGAGALTAMVPAAILILAPQMTEEQIGRLARAAVLALSIISAYLALHSSQTLVALLLLGYAGVTQFFPGVLLGLFWSRVTAAGVVTGLITGLGVVAALILTHRDPFHGVNAGFVALCINFAVTLLVSKATRAQPNGLAIPTEG